MGLSEEEIARKMVEKKRYPVKKSVENFINMPLPENPAHRLEVSIVSILIYQTYLSNESV